MKLSCSLAATLPILSAPVWAADLTVLFDLPKLAVAEYHKPYVAMWIERPDQSFVANLSVLYDQKKRDNGGTKWLPDLRQWWRRSGRDLAMPVDGVSGATRSPGQHSMSFSGKQSPLDQLPAGQYQLVIEAAREAGGRELVRVPLTWQGKAVPAVSAQGKEELGAVSVLVKP